ncbi:MAG: FkbM family methyltransferase [Polyangiales bacterium]
MTIRSRVRAVVNPLLDRLRVRVVHSEWGPRGFTASFSKLKSHGVAPRAILDIGAATGSWTRECAAVFPDAQYLLVDPLDESRPALEQVCQEPQLRARYALTALGASEGTLPLYVHGDQTSALASEYATTATRTVPLTTLDKLITREGWPAPDLIKIDVQGYELEVLRGAERARASAEVILLECTFKQTYRGCPLADEVIAAMTGWGFRIYDLCTYLQRPYDGELFQSDILFVRRDSRVFSYEGYA